MKSHKLVIILIAVSALAGCAGKPNKPDWMVGDTLRYQEAEFLIGHGDGVTSEEAKDRARADLAKIFPCPWSRKAAMSRCSKEGRWP